MRTPAPKVAPVAFSVGEVAELLGCSNDTVRRMIASGRLDAVQPLGKGGRVFIGRRSLDRLFAEAKADPVFEDGPEHHGQAAVSPPPA